MIEMGQSVVFYNCAEVKLGIAFAAGFLAGYTWLVVMNFIRSFRGK